MMCVKCCSKLSTAVLLYCFLIGSLSKILRWKNAIFWRKIRVCTTNYANTINFFALNWMLNVKKIACEPCTFCNNAVKKLIFCRESSAKTHFTLQFFLWAVISKLFFYLLTELNNQIFGYSGSISIICKLFVPSQYPKSLFDKANFFSFFKTKLQRYS